MKYNYFILTGILKPKIVEWFDEETGEVLDIDTAMVGLYVHSIESVQVLNILNRKYPDLKVVERGVLKVKDNKYSNVDELDNDALDYIATSGHNILLESNRYYYTNNILNRKEYNPYKLNEFDRIIENIN